MLCFTSGDRRLDYHRTPKGFKQNLKYSKIRGRFIDPRCWKGRKATKGTAP